MIPLHRDRQFVFRFTDDRIVPRFHLDGVGAGRPVAVYALDPTDGKRSGLFATATAGDGGWVNLSEPLVVRAGGGFVAVAEPEPATPDARQYEDAP